MKLLELPGAEVHHRIEGTGLPLLFLHGAGGNLLSWFQQIPYFSREFKCAVLDQPGFGASRWRSGATEFADVLDDYVEHLGWGRFAIVAHSLGGWAAVRFALRRPHQTVALVLSSSWAGIQVPEALRELEAREPHLQAARAAWVRQEPSSFMPGCGARLAREQPSLHWLASAIASLNRGAGQAVWQRDPAGKFDAQLCPETDRKALAGWRIPTLCIAGEEDVVVPPKALEAVARAIDGAEFVSIPRAGHSVFLERAEEFNGLVHRFLRRCSGVEVHAEGSGLTSACSRRPQSGRG
jgi:3-oxoadipate enol-lactonase